MDEKEQKIEELKIVQKIIDRMASNSFKIKGWAITIIMGTLILKTEKTGILLALLPTIVFWYLDTYYLQLEKKFRALYDKIVNDNLADNYIPFSLSLEGIEVTGKFKIMFSVSIGLLYELIGLLIIAYYIVNVFVLAS